MTLIGLMNADQRLGDSGRDENHQEFKAKGKE
jgi:hypothetical protein